jgi:hypothetical protein
MKGKRSFIDGVTLNLGKVFPELGWVEAVFCEISTDTDSVRILNSCITSFKLTLRIPPSYQPCGSF